MEVAHEALIRRWPKLRTWVDANREKLRARAAILRAKADWEEKGRRDDMLLPVGLQLERARNLLTDPGEITTDDIQEFVALSSAREENERKKREEDLARGKVRAVASWAVGAIGGIILIAGAIVGYLQWDKARQLATQVVKLTHSQANILAEISGTKLLSGKFDSALRLASLGTSIDRALPSDAVEPSQAAASLAAAVSRANWRFDLGGYDRLISAAFSPDGSRIVTGSVDKTARNWDATTAKEVAVLRGHDGGVASATFSPDGSRVVTASFDDTARLWDVASAKVLATLRGHHGVRGAGQF